MKNEHAQLLGKLGGMAKSHKKAEAVRRNLALAREKLAALRAAEQANKRAGEENAG